jgi:transposase-like protein
MDETYIGGRKRGIGVKAAKQVVIGIKERGGNVRFFHAPDATIETLAKYLKDHVSGNVEMIMTDDFGAYPTKRPEEYP